MPSRAKVKRCAESLQRHFPSVAGHYCFRNQKTFSVQHGPARLARGASHPGCGSQRLLRCRLHPAGRGPNSSSLFPPLAAVVAVALAELCSVNTITRSVASVVHLSSAGKRQQKSSPAKAGLQSLRYGINQRLEN